MSDNVQHGDCCEWCDGEFGVTENPLVNSRARFPFLHRRAPRSSECSICPRYNKDAWPNETSTAANRATFIDKKKDDEELAATYANGRTTWLAGQNAKISSGPASESSASNRGASKRKIKSISEGGLLSKKLVGVSLL